MKKVNVSGQGGFNLETQDQAKDTKVETSEKAAAKVTPAPSFIDAQLPDKYWCATKPDRIAVPVPGCECKSEYGSENPRGVQACKCKLPPCAFIAFKNLEAQQLTYNTNIANLETTVEQFQTTLLSLTTAPKPYSKFGSDEPTQIGSVQEEVRKWLGGVESYSVIV